MNHEAIVMIIYCGVKISINRMVFIVYLQLIVNDSRIFYLL